MKLIDLLSITDESTNVNVYDLEGNKVAFYDGKNSIDEEYNEIEVYRISAKSNSLEVTLQIEAD